MLSLERMRRWAEMTWTDIDELVGEDPVAVLPAGSVEQHGPHLPLGTDYFIPVALADRAVQGVPESVASRLVSLPPLTYTHAPHSNPWPGTANLDGITLTRVARDLVGELGRQGIRRLAILNGHMESGAFLWEGARLGRCEGGWVTLINWWDLVPDALVEDLFGDAWAGWEMEHAALVETALMMALRPDLVREGRTPGEASPLVHPYRSLPPEAQTLPRSGSFAPADGASKEIGERIAREICHGLAATLVCVAESVPPSSGTPGNARR